MTLSSASASKRIRQSQRPLPSTKKSVLANATAHVTRTLFTRRPVAKLGHRSSLSNRRCGHEDLRPTIRAQNVHALRVQDIHIS